MRSAFGILTASLLSSALISAPILSSAPAAANEAAGTRDAMHSVFESMRTLLELSTDSAQIAAPGNQRIIINAATELKNQASFLAGHASRDEISFLASSLDRYALWIRKSYEWRLYNDTRQLVHAAVDVCIACHTRLTSRNDSPLAEDFLDDAEITQLPARQRVKLQTATRRFDDALATYTTLLQQSTTSEDFDHLARDYLVLALRVKNDPRRARDLLATLLGFPELSSAHRARLSAWANSLQQLSKLPLAEADLTGARMLIEQAESVAKVARADSLVNYIVASRLLYGYLEQLQRHQIQNRNQAQGNADDNARAYYLLGLTQYRIDPDAWLPQAELHLEQSIRTAPASEHARKAIDLLTDKMRHNYPPAKGGMPADVRDHLQKLQDMVRTTG